MPMWWDVLAQSPVPVQACGDGSVTEHCQGLQVQSSTTVYVRRPGNPKKWQAEVLCIGHVCDLALLTVKDDSFWEADLMPLRFSDVPELQASHCHRSANAPCPILTAAALMRPLECVVTEIYLQDSILVAGYPSGGDSLSITKVRTSERSLKPNGIAAMVPCPCSHGVCVCTCKSVNISRVPP